MILDFLLLDFFLNYSHLGLKGFFCSEIFAIRENICNFYSLALSETTLKPQFLVSHLQTVD